MSHAMDCAEAPDKVSAIDANDLASREEFGKRIQRDPVVWVVKSRYQHGTVSNIEISVARGQPLALKYYRGRHRQSPDFEAFAILESRTPQSIKIFPQQIVVLVTLLLLLRDHDRIRCYKTCHVIHVAMGVVTYNAVLEPDHIFSPKVFSKCFFILGARHSRIALLGLTQ